VTCHSWKPLWFHSPKAFFPPGLLITLTLSNLAPLMYFRPTLSFMVVVAEFLQALRSHLWGRSLVKAVWECKPQGIGSYRVVEHVGIGTCRGFVGVRDLLEQGICWSRRFVGAGDLLAQRICWSRGVDPMGDLLK